MVVVDFEKTINRNKLVRNDNNLSRTVVMYALAMCVCLILYQFYNNSDDDDLYRSVSVYVIFPVAAISLGYLLYKKTIERRLFDINSRFDVVTTKKIVTQYLINHEWDIEYFEGNNIIATRPIGLRDEMQVTVIFSEEHHLLLNVIRNYIAFKGCMPILFADKEIKTDIEWEIKVWGTDKSMPLNP